MDRYALYARLERAVTDGASLFDALSVVDAVRDGVPVDDALRRIEHRDALTFDDARPIRSA